MALRGSHGGADGAAMKAVDALRQRWLLWALMAAAVVGNYFGVPMCYGVDFLFGSIAVLLAVALFGVRWGVATALVSSSCTFLLWGHPYGVVIFTAEAAFVGWMIGPRRRWAILSADAVFWLALGVPMVVLFYGVLLDLGRTATAMIMLKQAVNGVFNALVAMTILTFTPLGRLRRRKADESEPTVSIQQVCFVLLAAAVFVPALALTTWESSREIRRMDGEIVSRLTTAAEDIHVDLDQWYDRQLFTVNLLAGRAAEVGVAPSDDLQGCTALLSNGSPGLIGLYIANAEGRTVAFYPPTSPSGQPTVGRDYSDRDYFREVRRTRRPVLSGVFRARASKDGPIMAMAAPVVRDGQFAGCAAAALDLDYLSQFLREIVNGSQLQVTLLDAEGDVIASTGQGGPARAGFDWRAGGDTTPIARDVYRWMPGDESQPAMARWKRSYCVLDAPVCQKLPWRMVIREPIGPWQEGLYRHYITNLLIALVFALLAMALARAVSRRFSRPLSDLARATAAVPSGPLRPAPIRWPGSSIREIDSLVGNFRQMVAGLDQNARLVRERTEQLHQTNQDLQRQIVKRATAEDASNEARRLLENIAHGITDHVLLLSRDLRILWANRAYLEHADKQVAEVLGLPCHLVTHRRDMPCQPPDDECPVQAALATGLPASATHRHIDGRGRARTVEVTVFPVHDANGHAFQFVHVTKDVTNRKRAEQALRDSERKYRNLFEDANDAILVADVESGRVLDVNKAGEELLGRPRAEIVGMHQSDLHPPGEADRYRAKFEEHVRAGSRIDAEAQVLRPDGGVRDVLISVRLTEWEGRKALQGCFRDITEQKRAERALRDQMEQTQQAVEKAQALQQQIEFILGATRTGLDVIDGQFNLRYVDPKWQEAYGDPAGRKCHEYFMGRDEPCPGCPIPEALATKKPMVAEEILVREGGRPVQVTTIPFQDATGEWLVAEVNVDITERRRMEQTLRDSERRYRHITETITDYVFTVGVADGAPVNTVHGPGCVAVTGYRPEDFAADPHLWIRMVHAEDREAVIAQAQAILAGRAAEPIEHRIIRKDGLVRWARNTPVCHHDAGGRLTSYDGLIQDVTDRKMAEEALRQSEEKFRGIIENIGLGIALVGPDLRVIEFNRTMRRWFPRASLDAGAICYRCFPDPPREGPCEGCPALATLADGQVHELVCDLAVDGETLNARIVTSPLRDSAGRVVAVIEMVEDITERKRLEEQFRQAQKMEAVGQLAGGVAHDFNNILTGISGYAQLAMEQLDPGRPGGDELKEICGLSERAARLTQQLLAFSRKQTLDPVTLNLNDRVGEMLDLLRRLIGEHIELALCPAADIGCVRADPGQIEQVLMNMVVNSRDAMPTGGRITIETANAELDESYVSTHAEAVAGSYVCLAVTDSGCGMDQATLAHIFEPFFTTKEVGKGTGLGLATAYGIVKQHGGHIAVYSEPGRGTTFRIYLPRVAGQVASTVRKRSPQGSAAAGGTETVLLVEDEPAVRMLVARVLSARGYRVLAADAPAAAEDLFARHGDAIDLMLTDIVMPGSNGHQLYQRLAREHPGLKVLYMSGYAAEAVVRHGMLAPGTPFIQKPFMPDELIGRVRETLDAAAAAPAEVRHEAAANEVADA